MAERASSTDCLPAPPGPPAAGQPAHGTLPLTLAAAMLLLAMVALMFGSAWDDNITSDEGVHLAAGYGYLRKADYRMNLEHPPLIKDLAAVPLLFLHLQEPWKDPSWTGGHEWDFATKILYDSGVNPDVVTRAARTPMILFTLAFGWIIFWWTRRQFGSAAALLALFFYAFSPTFLANGRLVTTDVGAAAGFFIGTIVFLRFLKDPSTRNVLLAGLAMGFALLTKFSTALLAPLLLLLTVAWFLVQAPWWEAGRRPFRLKKRRTGTVLVAGFSRSREPDWVAGRGSLFSYLKRTAAIFAVAMLVVYSVYLYHTWNYPPELQRAAGFTALGEPRPGLSPRNVALWSASQPLLQPLGQYFTGFLENLHYSKTMIRTFYLGQIRTTPLRSYFPLVYLLKEPLALHILTLIALLFALSRMGPPRLLRERLRRNFVEFALLAAAGIYWIEAIRANLNIGIRHILPIFPFTYVLVATQVCALYGSLRQPLGRWMYAILIGALLAWQAISVVRVYPSYMAYFNELAGGPDGGWRYVLDSNLDWGQDLKRLAEFVQKKNIPQIYLNYFGSADPDYYLKGKHLDISGCAAEPPHGWVAVSAMLYPGTQWQPSCDYRRWLPMSKLVTKIGYSIFVFHLN